jgi:hypothetical protein
MYMYICSDNFYSRIFQKTLHPAGIRTGTYECDDHSNTTHHLKKVVPFKALRRFSCVFKHALDIGYTVFYV